MRFISQILKTTSLLWFLFMSGQSLAVDTDNDGLLDASDNTNLVLVSALDIDGDGNDDPLTDGLLLLRSLFGLTGDALISGVISEDAMYKSAEEITHRIGMLLETIDIDGDGNVEPLTDGLIVLRYLFGLRGDALLNGVLGSEATNTSSILIEGKLNDLAAKKISLSGQVIASKYLSSAKVCIDKNRSLVCDDDEDFAFSDARGAYTLAVNYEVDTFTLLAEATPEQTEGLDNALVASAFTLMAPTVLRNDQAGNNITAFTTLVSVALNDDPSMVNSKDTLERIQAAIKYRTGIVEPVGSDYLDSGDAKSKATAELFVSTLAATQQPLVIAANEAYIAYKPSADAGDASASAIIAAIDIATETALVQAELAAPVSSTNSLVKSSNNTQRGNEKASNIDSEAALAVSDTLGGDEIPFDPTADWMAAGGVVSASEENWIGKRGADGVCRSDGDDPTLNLEVMTLGQGGVVSTAFWYWSDEGQWRPQCFDGEKVQGIHVLGASGWFVEQRGDIEVDGFNRWDGNCIQEPKVPDESVFNRICVIKQDYSGESMVAVLPSDASSFLDPAAVFPENSVAYDISASYNTGLVNLFTSWMDSPSDVRTPAATAARSLEEFIFNSEKPFNDFPAWMGDGPVNLRLKSYDESTKTGEFVVYDSRGEAPYFSDGMRRYRFEVRSVFGIQFMVLEKTAFDKGSFFDSNEFTVFTYITEGEIAGTPPGIYRGELREIMSPFRLNVGNPYGDIVVSVNFLDTVFDNFGLPRFPR